MRKQKETAASGVRATARLDFGMKREEEKRRRTHEEEEEEFQQPKKQK